MFVLQLFYADFCRINILTDMLQLNAYLRLKLSFKYKKQRSGKNISRKTPLLYCLFSFHFTVFSLSRSIFCSLLGIVMPSVIQK